MAQLRVVFSTDGFPRHQQSFIENHVLAMAARGVDVRVLARGRGDHQLRPLDAGATGSVTVQRVPWRGRRVRKLLITLALLAGAIAHNRSELRRLVAAVQARTGWRGLVPRMYATGPALAWEADVLHIGWLAAATRSTDLLAAVDRPVIVSSHGSDLRIHPVDDPAYADRVREVFDLVDVVHCVSDDLARHAVALGVDPSKVVVIPWGVDTAYFCPSVFPRARTGALRVVSVGRVHHVKAYEHALEALALVQHAGVDVDYTIVGAADDEDRDAVLAAAEELGLAGSVHLRGVQPPDEVLRALRSSDVFLLTSLSEGLSTATTEAMAVGVPVVVTDVGGMRELVVDRSSGLVVAAGDPDAIAAALTELAGDEHLAQALGTAGRERVVAHFDVSVCAPRLLAEYERLAGRR